MKRPDFQEPVKDLSFPGLGKTAIFKLEPGKKILNFITILTVVASATGAATKTVPRPSWGIGDMRFKLGNFNRTRKASELFGVDGLQARDQRTSAGTVQYYQGGNVITATLNGKTVGARPVLIDSAEDLTLQAALANNTATTAVFCLPWTFAQYFRKDPMWGGDALGLPTAFDDGKNQGNVGAILGTPYVELDIPAATGVAGTMTGVNLSGSLVYSEELAAKGSVVNMFKQKVHTENYAQGDIELAKNFETKDVLSRFSVLCAADTITKIIVKHGSRIVREINYNEAQCADLCAEIDAGGGFSNRYDVDFDRDDDPTKGLALDPTKKLSIVATFATAADVPATCRILADYWGPVEN
jgi:hypothetical protein